MFLDLTPGNSNLLGGYEWEIRSPWAGELPLLNTGVSPKEEHESSLSQILEDSPHPRYYLSPKACLGILRRSKVRGKPLPKRLEAALLAQAGLSDGEDIDTDIHAYHINQRKEGIDLHGVAGALMATQNLQIQTFVAGFSPDAGSSAGSVGYRHTVWQCNNKFIGEHKCTTPHLTDATIKAKFLEAFNQLLADREALIADCQSMQTVLTDCSDIDREIKGLQQELDIVEELIRRCVDDNSSTAIDQDEYNARYNSLIERYDKAQERINTLKRKRAERRVKADAIGNMMFRLRELDQPLEYFDERLWLEVIDSVLVHPDGLLTFKLYDGTEVSV